MKNSSISAYKLLGIFAEKYLLFKIPGEYLVIQPFCILFCLLYCGKTRVAGLLCNPDIGRQIEPLLVL